MNCPNCGAALKLEGGKDHLSCDYCRYRHFPEPDADGVQDLEAPAGRSCPVCGVEMTHAAVDGLRLAHCRQCLGLLVEMEAFVVLVERVRSKQKQGPAPPRPADLSQLERELKCPGCGRRMDTHPYGGPGNIIIDNCPECGLNWLDHSELRRVVTAGESSRREPAWLEV